MVSVGPTEAIAEEAARWAVLDAYGDMLPEDRKALDVWLAADHRHQGAYVRAQAGLIAMEQVVTAPRALRPSDNDNDGHMSVGNRRGIAWACSIAGALAASLVAVMTVGPWSAAFHRPAQEEGLQVTTLKDGSVATLSDDARLLFATADGIRKVTLLSGSATFKVFKDKAHPFVVRSGDVYAQATGTVYSVERAGQVGGRVRVTEGSVLVWAGDEREQAVLLKAGGSLTLDPGLQRPAVANLKPAPALPPPDLARLSFDNIPIKAAVARFNRINSTQIIIADPAIGELRIVGLFRADDPERFARAVTEVSDTKMEMQKNSIVIKMK
ncbi:MAG: FecR domain-containing protein [Sphingomonadaceae bacterium]|nr:FecR domain-containing protein [Sphingomonadaceae bacterium]